MKTGLCAFVCGGLFAAGLMISGMTHPQKVIGFLDIFGNWDPSLAFVMASAVGVYALFQGRIRRRSTPACDPQWHVPSTKPITASLIIGASLFGVGWGLSGYCPGPALVSLAGFQPGVWMFVAAMGTGMLAAKTLKR